MLIHFEKCFSSENEIGFFKDQMHIRLKANYKLRYEESYGCSGEAREQITKEIEHLVKLGCIVPITKDEHLTVPFVSNCFVIKGGHKEYLATGESTHGKYRLVINYRYLNLWSINNHL